MTDPLTRLREAAQAFVNMEFYHDAYREGREELQAALAAMPPVAASAWIPCETRMPEINTVVLVSGGVAMWNGSKWISWMGQIREIQWKVTRWQPLPQDPPPEGAAP